MFSCHIASYIRNLDEGEDEEVIESAKKMGAGISKATFCSSQKVTPKRILGVESIENLTLPKKKN